ncbi:solute carrier family 15 member 2 [Nelusetta ayraudi]|uniref:solute carrier family 15 member 2 n=1 Tax=Nelusetta ayraudi TaxID=303726 RepID=UPI003F72D285
MGRKLCGTNYPTSICFIVVNEFCERFSYYGMKAVLTLYFLTYLKWDKDLSTAIYHAFSSLCYFTPVLGAIIADSWLGKFKTIIYLSIVYVIGHVIKSVGAIPTVGNTELHVTLSMIGLVLIAFGTGGIKPCVAAFGGDQFDEEHGKERQKFFSIFYMAINAGSLLSTLITPILRSDVQCFGGDCYALAFGVPAALMVVALVVFIAGSFMYKKTPPQGNVLLKVCKCIGFAIKRRWQRSKGEPQRDHWLDWAEDKYSKRLIQEIKMVLRVLVLYIPLPMFWALFDQQGSRWTIQAARMNMAFGGSFSIKPDQIQMLNALLILLFVPVFDLVIYPLVALCRINVTPLRKMAAGMIFAALAFTAATLVEINVVKTVVDPAPRGQCLLQVLNLAENPVSVKFPSSDFSLPEIPHLQDPEKYERISLGNSGNVQRIEVTSGGKSSECYHLLHQETAYTLILTPGFHGVECKIAEDNIMKNDTGSPFVRFYNTLQEEVHLTVGDVAFHALPSQMSEIQAVDRNIYSDVKCNSQTINLGLLDFGAAYTVVLTQDTDKITPVIMEDVMANNVHVAWQVPQYALMTMGEVMFSITGLEFSYSQAPANMKSVLQGGWLLTVAFGNVIVLIVAEGAGLAQWKEFVLFAALLVAVFFIFSIMAYFYEYVDPDKILKMYESDDEDEDDYDKELTKNGMNMEKKQNSTRM